MMKKLLLTLLFGILGVGVYGQTIKSLGYNTTNGQVVANTGTNVLTFTNEPIKFQWVGNPDYITISEGRTISYSLPENFINFEEMLFSPRIIIQNGTNYLELSAAASTTRTNIGLGWSALTNSNAATSLLGYNTNGQVVANTGANTLTFTNKPLLANGMFVSGELFLNDAGSIFFDGDTDVSINSAYTSEQWRNALQMTWAAPSATTTRTNLSLGAEWLTNTNVTNFRTAIGLGETNQVTFGGIANNGNFTNSSGTIYGFKTNVGPFEGIGNFFASNNTTVSNETLFRVGLAEQNNRSAQFGFRVARTNNGGEGFAVFSVFGYNALMMIGPSDRSRSNSLTNTNAAIEADIWSVSPTDKVMTLITTNTGAMQMHRPIGFNTNTNAPANTTNVAGWIEFYVGTNSVRVPYYQ